MTVSTFADLGLSKRLLRALDNAKYDHPTPIQLQAIPILLNGADLLGIAQTGTGKTAAFVLPLLQRLSNEGTKARPGSTRALVIAPTRELAIQIQESIQSYGRHMELRSAVVIGGVSPKSQIASLRRGLDILVATPGRLLDHVKQRHLSLNACGYFVIDEADRMFDMGFIRDVRKISAALPRARQTALFSATMPPEVARLVGEILHEPQRVEIASKSVAVERIAQSVHHVSASGKRDHLVRLLQAPELSKVVVFTRTKRGADQLVKRLGQSGVGAEALHGNKSQTARQRTLDNFRCNKLRVLVATDIASRGIDIDDITHVVNYELPAEPEVYVHRIGRTARAGAGGCAISFCDPGEQSQLRSIERLIRQRLDAFGTPPANETAPAPAKKVKRHRRRRSSGGPGGHRPAVQQTSRAA